MSFFETQIASAKRLYFAVGINEYENFPASRQLQRAVSDAQRMASVFNEINYDDSSVLLLNPTRRGFLDAWEDFKLNISEGDVVVFYFSGHGIEISGKNYLLPKDASFPKFALRDRVRHDSFDVSALITELKRQNSTGLTIIILDACRDDPFLPTEYKNGGGQDGGLAALNAPNGTFIMYASAAGRTALDRLPENDNNSNSVYTRHLATAIESKNYDIYTLARVISRRVKATAKSVGFTQRPAYYVGMDDPFCFHVCDQNPTLETSLTSDGPSKKELTNDCVVTSNAGCIKENSTIKYIQELLAAHECYLGEIDGALGPLSRIAMDNFNSANNTLFSLSSLNRRIESIQAIDSKQYKNCSQRQRLITDAENAIVFGDKSDYNQRFIRGQKGLKKIGDYHAYVFSFTDRRDAFDAAAKIRKKYKGISPTVVKSIIRGVTWWGVAMATWTTKENAILARDIAHKFKINPEAYIYRDIKPLNTIRQSVGQTVSRPVD